MLATMIVSTWTQHRLPQASSQCIAQHQGRYSGDEPQIKTSCINLSINILSSGNQWRELVRVVKEADLKSVGRSPRRFKSCSSRLMIDMLFFEDTVSLDVRKKCI